MDTWHRISTLQPQVHNHDQNAERNAGYAKLEVKVGREYRIRKNEPLNVGGGCQWGPSVRHSAVPTSYLAGITGPLSMYAKLRFHYDGLAIEVYHLRIS